MSKGLVTGSIIGAAIVGFALNVIIPRAEAEGFSPTRIERFTAADGTTCYVALGPKGLPRAMDCK